MKAPESNQSRVGLVWDLEWRLTLATALLVPLLISLGFWQLDRAEEKAALSERHATRAAMAPVSTRSLLALPVDARADRRISEQVTFADGEYLLLDNRQRNGRVGFEVVALARTETEALLVNLGWVPGDPARRSLPEVTLPTGSQRVTGRVYVPDSEPYTLLDEAAPTAWPAVVQGLPVARWAESLEALAGVPLFPHEIRIAANSPLAKVADWPLVNQTPAKHTAYAVQWFTMAAALLLAFVLRSTNFWQLLRRS